MLLLTAARFGYAARGAVYALTGLFAILAAIEFTRGTTGTSGTLEAAARWPLGQVWLALAGAGLLCFAGWRVIQAVFDPDHLGRDRKGLALRAGKALSALLHLGLAFTALELLDALEDIDEEADAKAEAAAVLAMPYGEVLLFGLAGALLAAAAGNLLKAAKYDFRADLICPPRARPWIEWVGRVGYTARGGVLALLALFLAAAAQAGDASKARSIGGALQTLETQPFGSTMVVALGAGFLAFGLYGIMQAWFRRFRAPPALT